MKPGTISYAIAAYAALMSIAAIAIGSSEGSWTIGLTLALIWAIIAAGCFYLGRRRRQHAAT